MILWEGYDLTKKTDLKVSILFYPILFDILRDLITCKLYGIYQTVLDLNAYEPRHDKTNKINVHPAKTQINLGIRPVWSESSLCAQRVAKDPMLLHADSKDTDQTGQMPWLIWVRLWSDWADAQADLSLCWVHSHFVGFVMSRLWYPHLLFFGLVLQMLYNLICYVQAKFSSRK